MPGGKVTVEKRAGHPGHYFVKIIDSVAARWKCNFPEDAVRVKQIGAAPDFESDVIMEVHVVDIKTVDGRSVSIRYGEQTAEDNATLTEVGGEVTLSNGARFENPLLPTGSRRGRDKSSFDLLYDATDWCHDWWGGYMEDYGRGAVYTMTSQQYDLGCYPGLHAFKLREGGVRCTFSTKNSRPQK